MKRIMNFKLVRYATLTSLLIILLFGMSACIDNDTDLETDLDLSPDPIVDCVATPNHDDCLVEEPEIELGLFDKMEEVTSYHASISLRSMTTLEPLNNTNLYYNNGVLLVWDYGEEVAYQTVDDVRYSILWIEDDYYGFELDDTDYTYLFDFAMMNQEKYDSYQNNQVTYEGLMSNEDVVYVFDDEGLVTQMSYKFYSNKGDVLAATVSFDSYDDINFTYENVFQTPTTKELAIYNYFDNGYFIRAADSQLKLFALNYTVVFYEEDDQIRIFFVDPINLEIDPNTKDVCVSIQGATVCYEFDDFFRTYSEYNFTKEEFNDFIHFYLTYLVEK